MTDLLNKVTQGDCLEVMKQISDKSVDMILCDLPYGTTACKWDTVIPFEPLWAEYERIIKPNGAIVLTASQPFTSALVMSNPSLFKYEWVWDKIRATNFMSAKNEPLRKHESILVFCKGKVPYYPQMQELSEAGKARNNRARTSKHNKTDTVYGDTTKLEMPQYKGKVSGYPKSILTFPREQNNQFVKRVFHPTQKPVTLFEYLIRTYTIECDIVLDNCLGSGTTAVAAVNTNRQFIGIERESEYVAIANQRISDAIQLKEGGR